MNLTRVSSLLLCVTVAALILAGQAPAADKTDKAGDKAKPAKTDKTKIDKTDKADGKAGEAAEAPKKKPLRVLFIGNSYTSYNKLPQVVAAMAAWDKTVAPIKVKMVAANGKNLVWHSKNKATLAAIAEGWDYVVLQDQSLTPAYMPKRSVAGARVLVAASRQARAKPMFFMTWQRCPTPALLKKHPDMHLRNAKTYLAMGKKWNVPVAPAGMAWKMAYDADSDCGIYNKDKSHPSPKGTYLTACVFYSMFYDKSPVGAPATLSLEMPNNRKRGFAVPQADAKTLQAVAWQAVEKAKGKRKRTKSKDAKKNTTKSAKKKS
jgi:hypothetical protein